MIRCNLAVLLAERGIKMAKVSKDTGISRTTLTSLTNNKCEGLQFSTLNTLCFYLKVTPAEILAYFPYDLRITHISVTDSYNVEIDMIIINQQNRITFTITARLEFETVTNRDGKIKGMKLYIHMVKIKNTEFETSTVEMIFAEMPRSFLSDINSTIELAVLSNETAREMIEKEVNIGNVSTIVIWNDKFFRQ